MKNGIYKVKPWESVKHISDYTKRPYAFWTPTMERNCPKSRQIRIFNDKWNISGEEFPVCPEMFEEGPI
jgi:hypothetical protein